MINRRLIINLIAFFVVSFALVVYGIVNLLGNPLQSPTTLTTQFADASGLYSGFEVELNGVPVGTVTSTSLTKTATKVTMRIDPGTKVPDDVQSSVQIANDLGEQVVNLVPSHGGPVPALASGADVPAAPDQVPANVGAVVASATRLLQAIPAGNLNKLIGELATSLAGQAGNLRTLISAGTTFSKEFVAYQQQFTELLANAPPSLDAITAVAPELRQDVANTAALVQVLAQQKTGLHTLLTSGSSAFDAVDNLLTSQSANLGCFLHDTADILVEHRPADQPDEPFAGARLQHVLLRRRRQHRRPGVGQAHHERRVGDQSDVPAHPPALPADPRRASAVLRRGQHHPRHAARRRVRDCVRQRRGPATQPGFTPAAGGHVVAPSAQQADVEVASATPVGQVASASYREPANREGLLLALGGLVVPALFLAWGARPSRRRTRRRA